MTGSRITKETALGEIVRDCLNEVNRGGKSCSEDGVAICGLLFRVNKEERPLNANIHLSVLPDGGWNVSSYLSFLLQCLPHHDGPYPLQLGTSISPFFLMWLLSGYSTTAMRE